VTKKPGLLFCDILQKNCTIFRILCLTVTYFLNQYIYISYQTLDCLEIIRTILEFVLGVNIGVSSKLSWIGVMPAVRSSLRSISAVKSLATVGLVNLFCSQKTEPETEIEDDKFGALWRFGVEVTQVVERMLKSFSWSSFWCWWCPERGPFSRRVRKLLDWYHIGQS